MSIFDTSSVEAGHRRLASSLSEYTAALEATGVLVDAALLHQNFVRSDPEKQTQFLALSQLGFRLVNDIGAAIKLLEAGYFVQAAALGRDMAELGMLAIHFAGNTDDLARWSTLKGKARHSAFGRPNLKRAAAPKEFDYFNENFDLFSGFGTHPSFESIAAHWDGQQLHIGPHRNISQFRNIYRHLTNLSWHTADIGGLLYEAVFDHSVAELLPTEFASFMHHGNVLRNLEINDIADESDVDDEFKGDDPTSPMRGRTAYRRLRRAQAEIFLERGAVPLAANSPSPLLRNLRLALIGRPEGLCLDPRVKPEDDGGWGNCGYTPPPSRSHEV